MADNKFFRVIFDNDQVIHVSAPDAVAAQAHAEDEDVRQPPSGSKMNFKHEVTRTVIAAGARVASVVEIDKYAFRRLQQLDAQIAEMAREADALRPSLPSSPGR